MPLDTSQESGPKIFGTSSQTITSGLLAALVAGSVVLFGRIYIPETSTQTTIIQRGTGSLLTSWDSITGPSTCSNTGGLAKYTGCSARNPSSGTSAIISLRFDADTWPVAATKATCMTSQNNVATGAVIFKYKIPTLSSSATGSGGSITASGNNLPLIPPNWYVRCWFDRTPGNFHAKLRILTQDTYVP